MQELQGYEIGRGKSKKAAKSEAAKKTIEIIAHIPDVQSVIISIMMSSNINETLIQNVAAVPKKTVNVMPKKPN